MPLLGDVATLTPSNSDMHCVEPRSNRGLSVDIRRFLLYNVANFFVLSLLLKHQRNIEMKQALEILTWDIDDAGRSSQLGAKMNVSSHSSCRW
jgi:hypothetical protein